MTNTLTTNKPYVLPGTYIGEDVQPGGVVIDAQTRIPTYVGRGSRYIEVRNSGITRGFINNVTLSFTRTSPFTAELKIPSNSDQKVATITDGHGVALREDQWLFVNDGAGIVISDPAFVSGETYTISYQGNDRTVPDTIPTADLRSISAIGSQIDQDQYKRGTDFYVDTTLTAPVPAVDANENVIHHTNSTSVIGGVTKVGTGLGTIVVDEYAEFAHKYNRDYKIVVTAVSGTQTTFAWYSTPASRGAGSAPAVPLASSVAAPTFVVDSTVAQTKYAFLEYGITVVANGTFVVGDAFTFSAYGPSAIELNSTVSNTNQYAEASAVVPDADNANTGNFTADGSAYTGTNNTNVTLEVVNVDLGAVSATVPSASIDLSGDFVDGDFYTINNGRTGSTKKVTTFEFDTNGVQAVAGSTLVAVPVDAAVSATGTITFTGSATDVPADGSILTLTDGIRTVSFEFDNDGILNIPTATRVVVDNVPGSQSANTAANLATAINASSLKFTASTASSSNNNIGKLNITAVTPGTLANVSIVFSGTGLAVEGMAGGKDASINKAGTVNAFINAVNSADLGIIAKKDEASATTVDLVHGARVVLSAQPAANDSFSVNDGSTITTFKFVTAAGTPAVGTYEIVIGTALTDTVAATVEAVASYTATTVVSHNGVVTVAPLYSRNVEITASGSSLTVFPSVVDDANAVRNGNATIAYAIGGVTGTLTGFTGGTTASDSLDRVTVAWGLSGETFASGTATLTEGKKSSIISGITLTAKDGFATASQGSITLNANQTDGKTITINDGIVATPVKFEFDSNATVVAGSIAVLIGASATATAANLAAAINTSALKITATATGTTVKLVSQRTGAGPANAYNTPIVTNSSTISVIGMANGGAKFSVGDKYTFAVKAPRTFTVALDDRITELTVQQIGTSNSADEIVFIYSSNTYEGGFGTSQITGTNPYITLPGQIKLVARNTNRLTVGDKFVVKHTNNGKIFWTLDAKKTESFSAASVLTDRNGTVTGTYGGYYITLSNTPYADTVKVLVDGTEISAGLWKLIDGSSIVSLNIDVASVATSITVTYTCVGNEPSVGEPYYISGNYLRPKSLYNIPQVFYDIDSAREALAPVTADNDVFIACDIAFSQGNAPLAVAVIQVSDLDDDGQISPADYDAALRGAAQVNYITDFIPLRLTNFMSKTLAYNVKSCDPFEKRENECYFGMPVGTPIGSSLIPDSLIFTATKTLQVYGRSYAHGTRIMVAPRWAKKTVTFSDGTVNQLTLDGSFVAAGVAACVAGAPNYSTTLLKSQLLGFDEIETFGRTINEQLGAAGILFFSNQGSGVYQFEEDQTVDFYAAEFHEILPMRTKQDVTRIVRAQLDAAVIGMVPNTRGDATSTIAAKITQILLTLINTGVIAPYQDENGNERSINSGDVQVMVDLNDTTKYTFFYTYYTRFAIKRLFGLYSVNKSISG
jgi:hypothetical protein